MNTEVVSSRSLEARAAYRIVTYVTFVKCKIYTGGPGGRLRTCVPLVR
jgi:hypothetical protein